MNKIFDIVIIEEVPGGEAVGLEVGDRLQAREGLGHYVPVSTAYGKTEAGHPFTIPKECVKVKGEINE